MAELTMREAGRKGGKTTAQRYPKRLTWGAGRPTDLCAEIAEAIVNEIVETSCSFYTAALAVGVPWQTAWQWERLGRQGRQPYAEFAALVMQARAISELELVHRMKEDWNDGRDGRGPLALLERRYPEDYGQRHRWEQFLGSLSDEQIDAAIEAAESAAPSPVEGGAGPAALPASTDESEERLEP